MASAQRRALGGGRVESCVDRVRNLRIGQGADAKIPQRRRMFRQPVRRFHSKFSVFPVIPPAPNCTYDIPKEKSSLISDYRNCYDRVRFEEDESCWTWR